MATKKRSSSTLSKAGKAMSRTMKSAGKTISKAAKPVKSALGIKSKKRKPTKKKRTAAR